MITSDIKIENEKRILRSIAGALWSLIALILATAYVLKQVLPTADFRRLAFEATSLMTQIQISSPKYGSLLFLLAFLGKMIILYIIYVLLSIITKAMSKKEKTIDIFEGAYEDDGKIILPIIDKTIKLEDIGKKKKRVKSTSRSPKRSKKVSRTTKVSKK